MYLTGSTWGSRAVHVVEPAHTSSSHHVRVCYRGKGSVMFAEPSTVAQRELSDVTCKQCRKLVAP